jgi:hypothetical protein
VTSDAAAAVLQCSRATGSLLCDLDYVLGTPQGSAGILAGPELHAEREWGTSSMRAPRGPADGRTMDEARTSSISRRLQEIAGKIALAHDWELT